MISHRVVSILLLSSTVALSQVKQANAASMPAPTTLPIYFTKTVSAEHSHIGEPISAKTSQAVRLANGAVIPTGAVVTGHIVAANAFSYDHTPYAKQNPSVLSVHFDTVQFADTSLPLNVTVRAMADPITSSDARMPNPSNMDSLLKTVTQIGGDQLNPSESEVVDRSGDVVAYNRHGGVYAHLIANGACDGGQTEVSVGIYSASACGLYGFTDVAMGPSAGPSTLTLVSSRLSPKIWKNSTALLEVLPTASR